MIIQKCDICNREVTLFDSIVLYSRPIDFCKECREKAERMKLEYKREIDCQIIMMESKLKAKELEIIKQLRAKNNRGIVFKKQGGTNDRKGS